MGIYENLGNAIVVATKNGENVVLCYRNSGKLWDGQDRISYDGKTLPHSSLCYFDRSMKEFDSNKHFDHYAGATVIVVNEHTSSIHNLEAIILSVTSSAWCSLEIILAKKVVIVSEDGRTNTTPAKVGNMNETSKVYKLLLDAVDKWKHSYKTADEMNNLRDSIFDVLSMTNSTNASDCELLFTAIVEHTDY